MTRLPEILNGGGDGADSTEGRKQDRRRSKTRKEQRAQDSKICPTIDDASALLVPTGGGSDGGRGDNGGVRSGVDGQGEKEDEGDDDDDEGSDGGFSVDVDIVDDVTCDEGFELGEVRLLLVNVGETAYPPYSTVACQRVLLRR